MLGYCRKKNIVSDEYRMVPLFERVTEGKKILKIFQI